MNGKYEPNVLKAESLQLGFGLTYNAAKVGRVCTIEFNGQLNANVGAFASLGTIAAEYIPRLQVVAPNCAYMDHYMMIQNNGNVALSKALQAGEFVQGTYTYITAN